MARSVNFCTNNNAMKTIYFATTSKDKVEIAQTVCKEGISAIQARYKNRPDAWHAFIEWYKSQLLYAFNTYAVITGQPIKTLGMRFMA